MRLFIFLMCVVSQVGRGTALYEERNASSHPKIEIKAFRFAQHRQYQFERLVVEFRSPSKVSPTIKNLTHPSEQESTFYLDKVEWVGAIPEAEINESYANKSRYLNSISINTDDPSSAAAIRVFGKSSNLQYEAHWMHSPERLVIDIFPEDSLRAQEGTSVLQKRVRFAQAKKKAPKHKHAEEVTREVASIDDVESEKLDIEPSPISQPFSLSSLPAGTVTTPLGSDPNAVICFPIDSQLEATVKFQQIVTKPEEGAVEVEKEKKKVEVKRKTAKKKAAQMQIICYRLGSQVVANVDYQPKSTSAFPSSGSTMGSFGAPPSLGAPTSQFTPPSQFAPQQFAPPPQQHMQTGFRAPQMAPGGFQQAPPPMPGASGFNVPQQNPMMPGASALQQPQPSYAAPMGVPPMNRIPAGAPPSQPFGGGNPSFQAPPQHQAPPPQGAYPGSSFGGAPGFGNMPRSFPGSGPAPSFQ